MPRNYCSPNSEPALDGFEQHQAISDFSIAAIENLRARARHKASIVSGLMLRIIGPTRLLALMLMSTGVVVLMTPIVAGGNG